MTRVTPVPKLNVKPFQETLYAGMCGPASLKMVFEYWGIDKSEQQLADLCNTQPDLGTSDQDLKRVAESFGLKVEIKNLSTFEDILYWLDKKVPVIVDWFTRGRPDYSDSEVSDGHYSVVVGLDTEYIYLQDPEIGALRKLKRVDFLKVWFDFKGETMQSSNDMIIRQLIAIYPDPSDPPSKGGVA
jgi:ABC-type bacteriocin/lantibiotic exporter with double-glycine peptidase domain